jgi:hypothetical protein
MTENEVMEHALIEFLKALTDWRVKAEASPFDHPELIIPNGVADDGTDILTRIPARNAYGQAVLTAVSLNPPASPTRLASQIVSGTLEAGATTPEVWTDTNAACGPVTVDVNTNTWRAPISGLVEGPNIVTIRVLDSANIEVVTTATIVLDTVPPAVSLNPVTTPTDLAVQTITGTREAGAAVQVSVNGAPPVSATGSGTSWSFSAALTPGDNTILVTAVDAAGNTAALPAATIFSTAAGAGQGVVQAGSGGGGGCFIDSITSGFPRLWGK